MTGSTPGPWKSGRYSSVLGLPITAQPNKNENTISIAIVLGGDQKQTEANGRLIGAAPELLEALRQAREDIIDLVGIATEMLNIRGSEVDPAERTYGPAVARIETAISKTQEFTS